MAKALQADIDEFVTLDRRGPWKLALLVARRVTPGEGNGVRIDYQPRSGLNALRRISAGEFARRAGTTPRRVMALWDAWNRLAADGVVPPAAALRPDTTIESPDTGEYPFYGKNGYYRSWEATGLSTERRDAVEKEAEKSGTRPSAITYVMTHPTAVKTALLADESTRAAAREALAEFEARQAAADAEDRAAAAEVTSERQREYDSEHDGVIRAERDAYAAQARQASEGSQAEALLVSADPALREHLGKLSVPRLIGACAGLDPSAATSTAYATLYTLKVIAERIQYLTTEVKALSEHITTAVEATAPALLQQPGIGPDSAATLLITAGDNPDRLTSEASFAALCGVSPLDSSSGKTSRRRLNRGGDRQANAALYRITLSRLRWDPRTQAYLQKRTRDGKTRREVIRCLKRYIARETHRLIINSTALGHQS